MLECRNTVAPSFRTGRLFSSTQAVLPYILFKYIPRFPNRPFVKADGSKYVAESFEPGLAHSPKSDWVALGYVWGKNPVDPAVKASNQSSLFDPRQKRGSSLDPCNEISCMWWSVKCYCALNFKTLRA